MNLVKFTGINYPFLFVLPDTHGSADVEYAKLNQLFAYGCKDVFLEGVAADSDFRSGEIFLSSALKEVGFNIYPIENVKLQNQCILALDIFYILAYKFHNLFYNFDCFEDSMKYSIKFLSLHESLDEITRLLKTNFDYNLDLTDLDEQKARLIIESYANVVLEDLLIRRRNSVFVANLNRIVNQDRLSACALVVGSSHVHDLVNRIEDFNIVTL